MIGPNKYIQGPEVIREAGAYIKLLGKKANLIGDKIVLPLLEQTLKEGLKKQNISTVVSIFRGECSNQEISRITGICREGKVDIVVGAGGGKTLDTAKAVGHYLKIPTVIIPTIAATDAPISSLAVIYGEDHSHQGYILLDKNPDLILVDTEIIANAPPRFFVSGMGDALATRFEAEACARSSGKNLPGGLPTLAAITLARLTYDILMEYGLEAKQAVEKKAVTPAVEKVVEANILLSGLGFESGGLAAAHAIQVGLTTAKEASKTYHGEKVAFGTLVQLIMEGRAMNETANVGKFCTAVGLPVTLSALGISTEEVSKIAEEAWKQNIMGNMPFPITPKLVSDCILVADSLGKSLMEGQ